MSLREIATDSRGYVFMSDSRDIAVSYGNRQEVYEWGGANKITIEYQGTMGRTDIWRVRDDEQRMWFTLKWGS